MTTINRDSQTAEIQQFLDSEKSAGRDPLLSADEAVELSESASLTQTPTECLKYVHMALSMALSSHAYRCVVRKNSDPTEAMSVVTNAARMLGQAISVITGAPPQTEKDKLSADAISGALATAITKGMSDMTRPAGDKVFMFSAEQIAMAAAKYATSKL